MNQFFNKKAVEYGCKRRVALVETSFNKHARSEKFKRTHIEITSKVNIFWSYHYFIVVVVVYVYYLSNYFRLVHQSKII